MKNLTRVVAKHRAQTPEKKPAFLRGVAVVARTVGLYRSLMLIQQRVDTAKGNRADFSRAKQLRAIAATEGFSRSLVALVNADGAAGNIFKNFPALEGLDAIGLPATTRRSQLAIEGIDEVVEMETDVVNSDTAAIVDATVAALRSFCDDLDLREDIGEELVERLRAAELGDDMLTAAQVTTISAAACRAQMEALIAVASSMASPSDFTGLSGADANAILAAIELVVKTLAPSTGMSFSDGEVTVDVDAIADEHKVTASTLAELGYTVDVTSALLQQMLSLIDVFENVRDNLPLVEDGLATAIVAEAEAEADAEAAGDTEGEAEGGDIEASDEGATEAEDGDTGEEEAEAGDTEEADAEAGADGESEEGGEEQVPEEASAETIGTIICSYATITATVINSATMLMVGLIELGEMMAEMAGANDEGAAVAADVEEEVQDDIVDDVEASTDEPVSDYDEVGEGTSVDETQNEFV